MIQVFLHVLFKSKCIVKQSKCLISRKNIPVHIFKNCDDWLGLMYLITMCAEKYKEQLVCLYRLTAY